MPGCAAPRAGHGPAQGLRSARAGAESGARPPDRRAWHDRGGHPCRRAHGEVDDRCARQHGPDGGRRRGLVAPRRPVPRSVLPGLARVRSAPDRHAAGLDQGRVVGLPVADAVPRRGGLDGRGGWRGPGGWWRGGGGCGGGGAWRLRARGLVLGRHDLARVSHRSLGDQVRKVVLTARPASYAQSIRCVLNNRTRVSALAARACPYPLQCRCHPDGGGYSAAGKPGCGSPKHRDCSPCSTRRVVNPCAVPTQTLKDRLTERIVWYNSAELTVYGYTGAEQNTIHRRSELMKPGTRDKKYHILITGQELQELRRYAYT